MCMREEAEKEGNRPIQDLPHGDSAEKMQSFI